MEKEENRVNASDRIIVLLRRVGPLTMKDIATALSLPKQTVFNALHLLHETRMVVGEPLPGNGRSRRWRLTQTSPIESQTESQTSPENQTSGNAFDFKNQETPPTPPSPKTGFWEPKPSPPVDPETKAWMLEAIRALKARETSNG